MICCLEKMFDGKFIKLKTKTKISIEFACQ